MLLLLGALVITFIRGSGKWHFTWQQITFLAVKMKHSEGIFSQNSLVCMYVAYHMRWDEKEKQCVSFATDYMPSTVFSPIGSFTKRRHTFIKLNFVTSPDTQISSQQRLLLLIWPEVTSSHWKWIGCSVTASCCLWECSIRHTKCWSKKPSKILRLNISAFTEILQKSSQQ